MRKTLTLLIAIFLFASTQAQYFSGKIIADTGEPLTGAVVSLKGAETKSVSTDYKGEYAFGYLKNGKYQLSISFIGYTTYKQEINYDGSHFIMDITLASDEFLIDAVTVAGQYANSNTPVAYTNVGKEDINKNNQGKDVPYLLQLTPSVTVSSDAGAGIGYTAMRVRGTGISRINVTLDGIPLNDAESHSVYWVDLPDYASSANAIQIQRGVGTSTSGAAAFGANIKFKTNRAKRNPYGEANFTGGSFNSSKVTFKAGTGIINKHFTFDARLSSIKSDGYIDRASSDLKSYSATAAYTDKKNLFRINILGGLEETYQAWGGVPKDSLATASGRTYNPYTYDNEIDHYGQQHYQLFYTREFNKTMNLNIALFHTNGGGYYEQSKLGRKLIDYGLKPVVIGGDTITKSDLIQRKWLTNTFRGGNLNFNYHLEKLSFTAGASFSKYDGNHFGKVIWMKNSGSAEKGHEWYRNTSAKTDASGFLSTHYTPVAGIVFWGDMQLRSINYDITGIDDDNREITQNNKYTFLNPKGGVFVDIGTTQHAYFSFATANREPKRSDLTDVEPEKRPTHETLYDYELGYKFAKNSYAFSANLYYMDYKNQLVQTGEINDVGDPAFVNVAKSYRTGIELTGGMKLFNRMDWNANLTYSQNKIQNFTEYVDNWDTGGQDTKALGETDISFSPNLIMANILEAKIYKGLSLSFTTKYVSEQYIDNTSSKARVLDAYLVNNVRLNYSFETKIIKKIDIFFAANNILNQEYETNAWVYRYTLGGVEGIYDGYFPQAKINFLAGLNLRF